MSDEIVVWPNELLREYGIGDTRAEAVEHLAEMVRSLHIQLRNEPDEALAPWLRETRDFLGLLFAPLP